MASLGFTNDWVQLPEDGTGKKTGYYRWDTGSGNYLYLGAGVIVSATGDIAPVSATAGLKVDLGADNDVTVTGNVAVTNADLTSIKTAVEILDNAIAGSEMQVDVVAALPAGTNNIGDVDVLSLPVLPAGNNNIGDVDIASLPAPLSTTGGGSEATAHRVTIANDSTGVLSVDDNGSSLSIDDGGNTITVDGTVAVTNSDIATLAGAVRAEDVASGNAHTGIVNMAVRKAAPANTSDTDGDYEMLQMSAGRLWTSTTIDAAIPAGNNNIGDVDVASLPALVAGNANIGDVDIASVASGTTIEAVGDVASDVPIAANPVTIGGRASLAAPTAVSADGDAVNAWLTRLGAQVVAGLPHLGLVGDVYTLTSKTVQVTTAQTGSDIWSPASGKKLVIISYQIQAFSTTAGTCIIWFGANADTTYSRGTDLAIFDGEFAPSATLKPGVVQSGIWIASAVDHEVHLTSVGDIDLTVTLWGYEI